MIYRESFGESEWRGLPKVAFCFTFFPVHFIQSLENPNRTEPNPRPRFRLPNTIHFAGVYHDYHIIQEVTLGMLRLKHIPNVTKDNKTLSVHGCVCHFLFED
jgi:hypothetical protein